MIIIALVWFFVFLKVLREFFPPSLLEHKSSALGLLLALPSKVQTAHGTQLSAKFEGFYVTKRMMCKEGSGNICYKAHLEFSFKNVYTIKDLWTAWEHEKQCELGFRFWYMKPEPN